LVKNIYVVTVGRFLFGLSAGAFSVFVPSYINEVTPTELKGPFGSATQLLITLGIFISNILGIPLPTTDEEFKDDNFVNRNYWRLLFALPIAFAAIQSTLLFTIFNYETPKFLKQHKKMGELNQIMGKIYTSSEVQARIDAIIINESNEGSPSYSETLCSPRYRIATYIGCALSFLQQLTGINIVMFYSSTILKSTGMKPTLVTALVGFVNFVSVFPTLILFKKFGRKILLWTLSFAISACLIGLGVCLILNGQWNEHYQENNKVCQVLSIVFLMLFIIFFEFSLGPLLWIYMSEIMTDKGLSLGVGVNWITTCFIGFFTKTLITAFGGGDLGSGRLFVGCGAITALCGVFVIFVVKETKGLSD
jgi:MFS transporter, SP family, galactose:H+ symporter